MKRYAKVLSVLITALALAACVYVGTPPSPGASAGISQEITPTEENAHHTSIHVLVPTKRNTETSGIVTLPENNEKMPLVIMCHGHGGSKEEGGGFDDIAAALAEAGIASIRVDYPGCGESKEDFTLNTMTNMLDDTESALSYMQQNYSLDDSRIGLFGYSMGGRISMEMLSKDPDKFNAVCLLAPAADTENLKELFGGSQNWEKLKATAEQNGYADFTTIYGQQQKLSKNWFMDLEAKDFDTELLNVTTNYKGPAMVIHAVDDNAVAPEVSIKTGQAMHAEQIMTPEDQHGYGFYGGPAYVKRIVVENTVDFFKNHFIEQPELYTKHESLNKSTEKYTEQFVVVPSEAYDITAITCIPTGKVQGAVVMMHGTGSTKNEAGNGYMMAAPVLAEKYGLATIRLDFPGYGDSMANPLYYDFKHAVSDALACRNFLLKKLGENVKVGVMGWSQGGTDAMLAAGAGDLFDSVVLWAGAPDLNSMLSDEDFNTAEKQGYFVMSFEWRDPVIVSKQWCEDVRQTDVMHVFSTYTGPLLAIAGEDDTTVDPAWAKKIVDQNKNENSKTYYIKGMDHTFNVFTEDDFHSLYDAVDETGAFFKKTLAE